MEDEINAYLKAKQKKSLELISEQIGLKKYYNFFDVFKLFKSFGFTKEIKFEEIVNYLPANYQIYNNIEDFTKGYINEYDIYKIYAINYGHIFVLIVVSSKDGTIISNYYGETINDFTMNIYYCLDIMCKPNPFCCN